MVNQGVVLGLKLNDPDPFGRRPRDQYAVGVPLSNSKFELAHL